MTHGNYYSRSLRLCVALFLSVAMMITFMPAFAFADTSEGQTKYLHEITFTDNNAHIFSVENEQGSVSLDDLALKVLDKDGEIVPEANYSLEIYATWWEDEGEKRSYPKEGEQYGLVGGNKDYGFTEYVVNASAKGGDYEGKLEDYFYVMDKHSLEYICSDVEFQGGYQYAYAMDECCDISLKDLKTPVVTANDGTQLTKDKDYTLNYYSKPNPFMRASGLTEEDKENCLLGEDDLYEGNPKENGFYIAEIAGIDPYYGSHWISLNIGGGITMDPMPGMVFSGEDTEITLDFPDRQGEALDDGFDDIPYINLGYAGDEGWYVFDSNSDEDKNHDKGCFAYDKTSKKLTLYGDKIYELAGENGWCELAVSVERDDQIVAYGQLSLGVSESETWYDFPEGRTLLPDWDEHIDDGFDAFIRNSSFPDGEDRWIEIESAEITSSVPDYDGETVIELEENDDGWDVKAVNFGTAAVKITYTDFDEIKKTAEINYTVDDVVYNVDLRSADNRNKGLPGTSLDLNAYAKKDTCKRGMDGENPYYYGYESFDEGFDFTWEIVRGNEYAKLKSGSGASNTLSFAEMPEGTDWINEEIDVKVTASDGDGYAERTEDYWLGSDFYQVTLTMIDENPDIGSSISIKPELWHYTYNADPEKISSADYICDKWDEEAINVEWRKADQSFILTRLNGWDVHFRIIAVVDDIYEEQWYELTGKNYSMGFDQDEYDIYNDCDNTIYLRKSEDLKAYTGDYEVYLDVGGHLDGEGPDGWESIESDSGVYTFDKANGKIIIYGSKIPDKYDNMSLHVKVIINDQSYDKAWSWCSLNPAGSALEAAKNVAKGELDSLLASKKEADYDADDWTTLTKAVTDGKEAIDKSTTTTDVKSELDTAKAAINSIKTKAQKAAEAAAAEKAKAEAEAKAKAAAAAAAEAKAKATTTVTINSKTVNASTIAAAIKAAGGKTQYVKSFVIDKKVKKISANAFKGTNITTLTIKSKKLKKKSVKKALKGSKVKTVKVKVGNKKTNKKYVKKYKKIFTKKNAGKKVKVK